MSPVEQTSTSSARTAERVADELAQCAAAARRPGSPVAAFALPAVEHDGRGRPPVAARCARLTCTGAARARGWS